jgi:hypothetical protein
MRYCHPVVCSQVLHGCPTKLPKKNVMLSSWHHIVKLETTGKKIPYLPSQNSAGATYLVLITSCFYKVCC